ncbi:MAG: bifunctional DNA-formamidopyrimidine glycosylase/DNA-(apurinic or apyrimidinic site) lyase [Bacillota bacterium]|nr:bifunctional DNA-formamidopyrimidine glycosylase/DNA-(apurinic or apyrimidinic site) lyase [Bacillota bacterium]
MPELPEIENLKRSLEGHLRGQRICSVELRRLDLVKHPEADSFRQDLCGKRIESLSRRGKFLLIHMEDGCRLVFHLRMSGRLVCADPAEAELPHTHLCFRLENGKILRYSDVRRFGCIWLLAPWEEDHFTGMERLGPDALASGLSGAYLQERLCGRRISVKQALLDQHVLAGLGNIYVDEVLFQAGIRPDRFCKTLQSEDWQRIAASIPPILESAILHRGTSFSDYLDGEGKQGENQNFLKAYQRGGELCCRCGTVMEKIRVAGRGSCFCPQCQK